MGIAGVFPGQGSQSVGMLSALAESFDHVKQTFEEASEVLQFDLWKCCGEGPADSLNQTENTQPAMLAADVAVWRVWQAQSGAAPSMMAGHSLGEYSALVASGAMNYADAVKLVRFRAESMQASVEAGQGAMAAILGLDDDVIVAECAEAAQGQVVQAVNFNSPGQVVIAGDSDAVDRAIDRLKAAGAKRAMKLAVSVPSHCDLMKPAAEKLAEQLKSTSINLPEIRVLHNVDAQSRDNVDGMLEALSQQLYLPVRWVDTVKQFTENDLTKIIEFGPGKVLTGLNRRIDRGIESVCITDPASLDKALLLAD